MVKTLIDAKFKLAVIAALGSIVGLLSFMAHKQVDNTPPAPTPGLVQQYHPTEQEAKAVAVKPFTLRRLP